MSGILMQDGWAFLPGSSSVITFSQPSYAAFNTNGAGSAGSVSTDGNSTPVLPELITKLRVAPWGEDNRFPQNIVAQLDYSGVAKAALDFKARALFGGGIVWGEVTGYDENGTEIFVPTAPGAEPEIEQFMEDNDHLFRFYLEFNQDWVTFVNCFPELVASKDGKKIKKLVHQESCDCRFIQMDDKGRIQWVLLSKLWGMVKDQFVQFDPRKAFTTAVVGGSAQSIRVVDNKYIKQRRALDPYNALEDLQAAIAEGHRNIILPVQYPSANKTYYQLAVWDGSRKAGWLEIAAKIPGLIKVLYDKAFNFKYHIKFPANYFEKYYTSEVWQNFTPKEQLEKKQELLQRMDKFLSGSENAYKTFISYFDVSVDGKPLGVVEIVVLEDKTTIDKELLASSAANSEILFSHATNPDLIGAGTPGGPYSGSAGSGSNIREAFLVYLAQLPLERHTILEPLRLVHRFNKWNPKIRYRFRDTVLTTLDKNTGTEKKIS